MLSFYRTSCERCGSSVRCYRFCRVCRYWVCRACRSGAGWWWRCWACPEAAFIAALIDDRQQELEDLRARCSSCTSVKAAYLVREKLRYLKLCACP